VFKRLLVAVSSLVVVVCAASPATAVGQSPGDSVKGSADDCIPYPEPLPGVSFAATGGKNPTANS
jgi:hypothetical protein